MALFHDADVELKLLLALVLAALEPATEDLQEGGASSEGGEAGDDAVHELAHAGGSGDLQAIAGGEGEIDLHRGLLGKRPARRRGRAGRARDYPRLRVAGAEAGAGSWTRSGFRSSMTSM